MLVKHSDDQAPGCSSKRMVPVGSCLVLVSLFVLFFCAWSLGIPAVMALQSMPILSGADIKIDGRLFQFTEDGTLTEVMYYVHHPWPEVVDFYREEMSKRGWKLEKEYKDESLPRYVATCMIFRRAPGFVVSVEALGFIENNTTLAETNVTMHSIMRKGISCK